MIYLPAEQTSGLGTIYSSDPVTEVICSPPICYPPQPYIAPTPAAAPTQAVYAIEYDLGWNHDVVLASGSGLSLDITVDNVARDTAGVVIGVADLADTSYEGLGKYDAYLLFEGTNVSVYEGGTRVWGAVYRAAGDVFTLQQVDTQVAVLRNGVVIYVGDLLKTTQAAFIATIYKGGEGVCFVVPPTTSGALAVGTAGADATLPALIALGGLYAQAEILLPAPTLEAYGYGHGGADIDLPALFGIGAEGSFGWAMLRLPAPSAVGYAADAGINHADLDLPPLGVLAGVGTYAFGDAKLPALAGGGSGGFVSPVSQGADLDLPHLILGALGYTGGIGGANLTLPAIDGLASEDAYGEVDVTLPALRTFAGELPDYDGVLYGRLSGLEVVDFWGYQNAPDAVIGRLGPLVGSLYGGANLDGALASLSGALTGTLEVVGRISGTLAELGGALHALVGATATLDRPLGLGLRGELFGGAQLDGELPALRGASSGDLDTIGTINGTFVLSGSLSGTHEDYGRLSGSIGELGALWGVLDGVIVALDGELVASQVTVAEYAAWVMNLAHNGLSRYPAYPFDFVVRWQRRHYLANSDRPVPARW